MPWRKSPSTSTPWAGWLPAPPTSTPRCRCWSSRSTPQSATSRPKGRPTTWGSTTLTWVTTWTWSNPQKECLLRWTSPFRQRGATSRARPSSCATGCSRNPHYNACCWRWSTASQCVAIVRTSRAASGPTVCSSWSPPISYITTRVASNPTARSFWMCSSTTGRSSKTNSKSSPWTKKDTASLTTSKVSRNTKSAIRCCSTICSK